MDTPWYVAASAVCVGDNETVTININGGNTISSDVEGMKAVAWWYDSRHENGTDIDNIDLGLYTTSGSYLIGSFNSYDEKERVEYPVFGLAVQLRLFGTSVTADNVENCGTNQMKVYYALFYEDSDRDDSDGPSSSLIEPEW